ncbi:hypothetical protein K437DRAFT_259848 [Tilletiaria anomala UBC 951]|uniref:DUF6924 domain-containing protein n=1 Tax=Tilletiaria anomala (strain ATCC 24038 / CBS 436.72 / UBC 951) TaxID=1037660 RepID=A0A066VAE0_TILAU|nr:uncharacterized protein K437DRAFT_259848 [Tilletiaria anomala UBC 951]KDN37253.1 hypothetical protein K437DRAFT_259848 [Tilletiaria anomala UBC 951]
MAPVALYNADPSQFSSDDLEGLLSQIRSTSYIDEVTSGETSAEDSGLWEVVLVLPSELLIAGKDGFKFEADGSLNDTSIQKIAAYIRDEVAKTSSSVEKTGESQWSAAAVVIADQRTKKDGSLLLVEIDHLKKAGVVMDKVRVVPRSVIEIACNVEVANMSLSEFKSMSHDADVFDSGH